MTKDIGGRAELEKYLSKEAAYIRKQILRLSKVAGGGHMGGGLSMVDVTVALYHHVMNIDPSNPDMPERDRFILSKGHGSMPGQDGRFDEKTRWDLVNYVRTLPIDIR